MLRVVILQSRKLMKLSSKQELARINRSTEPFLSRFFVDFLVSLAFSSRHLLEWKKGSLGLKSWRTST